MFKEKKAKKIHRQHIIARLKLIGANGSNMQNSINYWCTPTFGRKLDKSCLIDPWSIHCLRSTMNKALPLFVAFSLAVGARRMK